MPTKTTMKRVQEDKRAGKAATTQAGEFVREEMEHKKEQKHPIKSRAQAIAIGLSKARRAGVKIPSRGKKDSAQPAQSRSRGAKKAAATRAQAARARNETSS
jgi:hypothetical protein